MKYKNYFTPYLFISILIFFYCNITIAQSPDYTHRINKIETYEFDKENNKKLSTSTIFKYKKNKLYAIAIFGKNSFFKSSQTYNERRYMTSPISAKTNIQPSIDIPIDWNKTKGTIFIYIDLKNKKEEYQYRYNKDKKNWMLFSSMKDSLNTNGLLVERHHFLDNSREDSSIQESIETYTYQDTLLTQLTSKSRKGGKGNPWQYQRKEIMEYNGDKMTLKQVHFYSPTKNKFVLTREDKWEYKNNTIVHSYLEKRGDTGKIIQRLKTITTLDKSKNPIETKYFEWDPKEKELYLKLETKHTFKNQLKTKDLTLNHYNSGTDYHERQYEYDRKNRVVKSIQKIKRQQDQDWKISNEKTYSYTNDNTQYSSYSETKNNTKNEMNIDFDKYNNPIKKQTITNNKKREITIEHNTDILFKQLIPIKNYIQFRIGINDNHWMPVNIPIKKTTYKYNGDEKIIKKEVEFIYENINQ